MKKSLVLMAMAGVALAGCVNDVADVAQNVKQQAYISFDAPVIYTNGESRANFYGEIEAHPENFGSNNIYNGTYSYPTIEKFTVFAKKYEAGKNWTELDNFWNNGENEFLEVSYDKVHNGWSPMTKHVWPGYSLVFAAYSPSDLIPYESDNLNDPGVVAGNEERTQEAEEPLLKDDQGNSILPEASMTDDGLTITNFKVADDPQYQFDLLYTTITTPSSGNAAMNPDKGQYYGKSLAFKHALSSIHFSIEKPAAITAEIKLTSIELQNVKTIGDLTSETNGYGDPIKWTLLNGYTHTYIPFPNTATPLSFPSGKAAHIGHNGGFEMLLLPQETDPLVLVVHYTVGSVEKTCTVDLGDETDMNDDTNTIDFWRPGHRYVYNLMYSNVAKDFIFFNPTTPEWTNVDININLTEDVN